jgi:archaellum component FlaC
MCAEIENQKHLIEKQEKECVECRIRYDAKVSNEVLWKCQIDNLTGTINGMKQDYEQLKKQYDELSTKYNLLENEKANKEKDISTLSVAK